MGLTPNSQDWEQRVRDGFAQQRVMALLGAELREMRPGDVEIHLPFREELTQQHGFLHAGIVTTILDSACGYAAFSLMPPHAAVLTVEYKVNLLAPAQGSTFVARGRVLKAGRTLTVCTGDVHGFDSGADATLVATMQTTMMAVTSQPGPAGR